MFSRIRQHFSRRRVPQQGGMQVGVPVSLALGGSEREITPLFVDLNGYVGLAERLSLAQLQEVMNAYFAVASDTIAAEGGTIDRFIGDVVVAMFGAPVAHPDHALHGCVAALNIQSGLEALRKNFQRAPERWPEPARHLRARIGMHTGVATVGPMGTKTRFNFTMMGDNVNLAARLESGAKHWGARILCSAATRRACEQRAPGRILFRSLGDIVVVGRAEPLEIFEPMAFANEATPDERECIDTFHAGLDRYRAQDWEGAEKLFRASASLERDQPGRDPGIAANPSTVFAAQAAAPRQAGVIQS